MNVDSWTILSAAGMIAEELKHPWWEQAIEVLTFLAASVAAIGALWGANEGRKSFALQAHYSSLNWLKDRPLLSSYYQAGDWSNNRANVSVTNWGGRTALASEAFMAIISAGKESPDWSTKIVWQSRLEPKESHTCQFLIQGGIAVPFVCFTAFVFQDVGDRRQYGHIDIYRVERPPFEAPSDILWTRNVGAHEMGDFLKRFQATFADEELWNLPRDLVPE